MKRKFHYLVLSMALLPVAGFAQQQATIRPCDTYAAMDQVFASDPAAKVNYDKAQAFLEKQLKENNITAKAAAFEYTVPVVFHVLHIGGGENVSDATCIAALDWVNKDFNRGHADANTVAAPFEPLYVPGEIKFMLAKKDPSGNPTTGIVHRYDVRTDWDRINNSPSALFGGITWNTMRYLNIIIVKDIVASPGQQGVVIGYTYKPGTWSSGAAMDAIVYRSSHLSGGQARLLSHEVGHWLNLSHTFGDTNNPGVTCGDDGISQTPPTMGYFSTCPSSLSGNTCPGSGGQANVENIMDYSSCAKNFVQGQTDKMRTALASAVSARNNLWSSSNITFTDVNGFGPCCPPIAEFLADNGSYTVCSGSSISFKNFSYNGPATGINWMADNGATPGTPTSLNTIITFPVPGNTNVSLTMSNSQGSSTKTRQVTVIDATPGMIGPVMESFEGFDLPLGWATEKDVNAADWTQTYPLKAYNGEQCIFVEPAALSNKESVLISPVIDLQSSPEKVVTFAYAYARKSTSHHANLFVDYTLDCGGSWQQLLMLDANTMQMNSGGVTSEYYLPADISEWKVVDFTTIGQSAATWIAIKNSPHLKLRFRFKEVTGGGNNFFLDAINLPGELATGVNALSRKLGIALYPNPANGKADLEFTLQQTSDVKVSVFNLLGGEVSVPANGLMAAGEQKISVNSDAVLTPGVYFVNLSVNGSTVSRKLIIE